jgi:hypothetical protein
MELSRQGAKGGNVVNHETNEIRERIKQLAEVLPGGKLELNRRIRLTNHVSFPLTDDWHSNFYGDVTR